MLKPRPCNPKDVVLVISHLSLTGGLAVLDHSKGAVQQALCYDQFSLPRSRLWGSCGLGELFSCHMGLTLPRIGLKAPRPRVT